MIYACEIIYVDEIKKTKINDGLTIAENPELFKDWKVFDQLDEDCYDLFTDIRTVRSKHIHRV